MKVLAGEDRKPRAFDDMRVGGAGLPIQDRHLSEKVAVAKLRQRHIAAVRVFYADANTPCFDEVHGIAAIAGAEQHPCRSQSRTVSNSHNSRAAS